MNLDEAQDLSKNRTAVLIAQPFTFYWRKGDAEPTLIKNDTSRCMRRPQRFDAPALIEKVKGCNLWQPVAALWNADPLFALAACANDTAEEAAFGQSLEAGEGEHASPDVVPGPDGSEGAPEHARGDPARGG